MSSPLPAPPPDAAQDRRGLVSTGPQTFAGMKIFLDPHRIAFLTTAQLPSGGTELMGFMAYNSDTKKLVVHDGDVWVPVVMVSGGGGGTPGSLEEHINAYPAHDAEQVSYEDTNVRSAISSLRDDKLDREELSGPYGAQKVGALPYGGVSGSTVEAQIHYLADGIEGLLLDQQISRTYVPLVADATHGDTFWGPLVYFRKSGLGYVSGSVTWNGSYQLDGIIGTLPPDCRPRKRVTLQTTSDHSTEFGNPRQLVFAYIDVDGSIVVFGGQVAHRIYLDFPPFECAP